MRVCLPVFCNVQATVAFVENVPPRTNSKRMGKGALASIVFYCFKMNWPVESSSDRSENQGVSHIYTYVTMTSFF